MKKTFLFSRENRRLIKILNPLSGITTTQFVGGCVRKAIEGKVTNDIDLATTYKPEEVKKLLIKNNFKIFDVGIKYGSITTFLNNYKYEITSLRKDLNPDGRYANIKLINNWYLDSQRRDFTINAIYCDKSGKIFDPVNGISDLKEKKINFIGNADLRIKEDYIRILRFVRFSLEYETKDKNQKILNSIKKNIRFLRLISPERLFIELKKILELKNFYNIKSNSDWKSILHKVYNLSFFDRLNKKKFLTVNSSYLRLLSLLLICDGKKHIHFSEKFKLSNKESNYLNFIYSQFIFFKRKPYNYKEIKKQIYLYKKELTLEFLYFIFILKGKVSINVFKKYQLFIKRCKPPVFPISGQFLIRKGFKQGKKLGKKLAFFKNSWINNNFKINLAKIQF
jgi:tRNA nucleotidyltransferase/poly(A) polymerase